MLEADVKRRLSGCQALCCVTSLSPRSHLNWSSNYPHFARVIRSSKLLSDLINFRQLLSVIIYVKHLGQCCRWSVPVNNVTGAAVTIIIKGQKPHLHLGKLQNLYSPPLHIDCLQKMFRFGEVTILGHPDQEEAGESIAVKTPSALGESSGQRSQLSCSERSPVLRC